MRSCEVPHGGQNELLKKTGMERLLKPAHELRP